MRQLMGRQELLSWINEFTECDYPKIELLSDGIAFCQVMDALHSGVIQLSKLNFNARYPEDCLRNLRVLDDTFTKLRIEKVLHPEQISKGKFQENMNLLQWMYNYAAKVGPFAMRSYKGYKKRLEAFEKSNHKHPMMSAHLIPNNEFLRFKHNQFEEQKEYSSINQVNTMGSQINKKLQVVSDELGLLESDLKNKMEYNWKLIYALDDMVYQRETLHKILLQITEAIGPHKDEYSRQIQRIISEKPEDFITK